MPYNKTNWQTARITADNFNKLQTQYAEAVADAIGIRANGTAELQAEVVSDFPAHAPGRIIFHTGKKMFFYSNGTDWLLDPKETFWGDAQNGVFSSTGNVTFANTLGQTVIRNYRNFTLNPGHTITTQTGCRCLVIRAWGDITINGIVDLDYKGGFGDRYISIGGVQYDLLGGLGGNGGASLGGTNGGTVDSGLYGAGGMRGGGGGGGSNGGTGGAKNARFDIPSSTLARGERVSSLGNLPFANGVHGGGGGGGADAIGMSGTYSVTGGPGRGSDTGAAGGGGGGIQIRFTSGFFEADGGERPAAGLHGGGCLILLAMGSITINGQIRARGSKGGRGGNAQVNGDWDAIGGGGGGGSGGGKIVVLRRGNYNFAGQTLLTGGAGGIGGNGAGLPGPSNTGQQGATGTVSIYQL